MTDTANHEVNIEAGRSLLGSAVRFLVMFLALALPFLGVESLTVLMGLLMILFWRTGELTADCHQRYKTGTCTDALCHRAHICNCLQRFIRSQR